MIRSAIATARSNPTPSRRSESILRMPQPVIDPYIRSSPGRYETSRRTSRLCRQQSNPATFARPDVGRNKPSSRRIVVVFPDPFGPEQAVHFASSHLQAHTIQGDARDRKPSLTRPS